MAADARAPRFQLAREAQRSEHEAMRFRFFLLSLVCLVLSVAVSGPVVSLPLVVSAGMVAVAVVLLFRARGRTGAVRWIVVDGSNVMYWDRETPSLDTVREVLRAVEAEGFVPLVWFDANAGHVVAGQYLRPEKLAKKLGLRQGQVLVAPKGTPADPLLLEEAARLDVRVVTNDRFRDWAGDHPMVQDPDRFVRGSVRDGVARLAYGGGARPSA
jgi:hypothetical protein